jgi:hypothetical protein
MAKLIVIMSDEELQLVHTVAQRDERSTSNWARHVILNVLRSVPTTHQDGLSLSDAKETPPAYIPSRRATQEPPVGVHKPLKHCSLSWTARNPGRPPCRGACEDPQNCYRDHD